MGSPPDLRARVPELASGYTAERLSGGAVNRSWKLLTQDGVFVLREGAGLAPALGLDRCREIGVLRDIAAPGIGPELVWGAPAEHLLLTRYIDGSVPDAAALRRVDQLHEVGRLLARVHATRTSAGCLDYAGAARRYAEHLRSSAAARLAAEAEELAELWCGSRARYTLCHHDPIAGNIARRTVDNRLCLLDWEYAAAGEPCMDLAAISEHHGLAQDEFAAVLEGYGRGQDRARLAGCAALYARLAVLWLMVVCAAGPVPPSYREALARQQGRLGVNER